MCKYVDSLCTSRLLYNGNVWAELSKADVEAMIAAHLAPCRTVVGVRLGRPGQPHGANVRILLDTDRIPVPDVLRLMRLRYVSRLMTSAPLSLGSSLTWRFAPRNRGAPLFGATWVGCRGFTILKKGIPSRLGNCCFALLITQLNGIT
eukprot:7191898-Pyramimonas_sp.AAC.1